MRRLFALGFSILVLTLGSAAPASALATWTRPVPGRVTRSFQAPRTRYGAGHLGVDFATLPGTTVRAAAAGTVVFAGVVAGIRHVVVRHANGWRTSYAFLASIRVRRDETVSGGQVLGTAGGTGANHRGNVVHLGLRIGDTFVDPMRLFEAESPATHVHLAPEAPAGTTPEGRLAEVRALAAGLRRSAHAIVLDLRDIAGRVVRICDHWPNPQG
jgi:hypothetical protein